MDDEIRQKDEERKRRKEETEKKRRDEEERFELERRQREEDRRKRKEERGNIREDMGTKTKQKLEDLDKVISGKEKEEKPDKTHKKVTFSASVGEDKEVEIVHEENPSTTPSSIGAGKLHEERVRLEEERKRKEFEDLQIKKKS